MERAEKGTALASIGSKGIHLSTQVIHFHIAEVPISKARRAVASCITKQDRSDGASGCGY